MKEYCQSTSTLHPLHLLDDLLASISSGVRGKNNVQLQDDETSQNRDYAATENDVGMLSMAEAKQDLVLRAADELFCNNMTLLENALALLDEQEQYQREYCKEMGNGDTSSNNPTTVFPVIRKIRAKRSGRTAVLVRKQRKNNKSLYNKSKSAADNNSEYSSQVNDSKKKQKITDDFYLCIMGKDKLLDQRSLLNSNNNDSGGWDKVQRCGAHCTCRAFSQNIKGGNNGRSSQSQSSSSAKGSSSRNEAASSATAHSSNAVVCKHLLAAILLPHMLPWSNNETGSCGMEDEIVEDKEFAKLIMRASIG